MLGHHFEISTYVPCILIFYHYAIEHDLLDVAIDNHLRIRKFRKSFIQIKSLPHFLNRKGKVVLL